MKQTWKDAHFQHPLSTVYLKFLSNL